MSTAALAPLKTTSSTGLALLRKESVVDSILIALVGLGYRATFITQGFDATDEGWLQSAGRRITLGQVPYRDSTTGDHLRLHPPELRAGGHP